MFYDEKLDRFQYIHLLPQMATYVCFNSATVRQTAKRFGVSKSTVWKYLTELLPEVDSDMYVEVRKVLDNNKSIRAHRGGMASSYNRKFSKKSLDFSLKSVYNIIVGTHISIVQ